MNTLEYLFSDEEKIKTLEKMGYAVKEGTTVCTHHEYHDRVEEDVVKVMKVYRHGIEIPYNFQNVSDRNMSHVNETLLYLVIENFTKDSL